MACPHQIYTYIRWGIDKITGCINAASCVVSIIPHCLKYTPPLTHVCWCLCYVVSLQLCLLGGSINSISHQLYMIFILCEQLPLESQFVMILYDSCWFDDMFTDYSVIFDWFMQPQNIVCVFLWCFHGSLAIMFEQIAMAFLQRFFDSNWFSSMSIPIQWFSRIFMDFIDYYWLSYVVLPGHWGLELGAERLTYIWKVEAEPLTRRHGCLMKSMNIDEHQLENMEIYNNL